MIAVNMLLQSSENYEPVSAYFAFETIELPKLAFGNDVGFEYMWVTDMILDSSTRSESLRAKFTYKFI